MIAHRLFIPTLLLPLLALTATAQVPEAEPTLSGEMTLSQCITYAQRHSPDLIPARVQMEQLEVQEESARMNFLPDLNAGVGQNFSFGYTQGHDKVLRKNNGSSTGLSVSTSLSLFEGGARWWALKSSQEALESKDYILDEVEDRIALTVASSYVGVLLAQQIVEVAEENLSLSLMQQKRVDAQVAAGKLAPSEQLKMRTQVGQDRLALNEAKSDLDRAMRVLRLDMGITEEGETFTVPQEDPESVIARLERESPYRAAPEWTNPSLRLAQLRYDLSSYDVKRAKAGYMPRLSLSGGYSNGYFHYFGDEVINQSFGDQLKSNGQYTIGLSLSIPIFNRGQVRASVRQAELQRESALGQLIQQQFSEQRNITLATADLRKAEESYRLSKDNVEVAQESLDMTEKEYNAGRITAYEWEQSKNKLIGAKSQYLQSVYTRLLRSINLTYYLTGTLPR